MIYQQPGQPGSIVSVQPRYGNYINGQWVEPSKGLYFDNVSPVTGQPFCQIPPFQCRRY